MEEGTEGMLGGQWGRSATREGTVGLVEDSSATRAHQEHTGGIWVPIIPGDKGGSRCGGVPLRSWCYTNPPHHPQPRRLVISCPEDSGRWGPALGAQLPLLSAELLLTGLLRQQLQLQPFLLTPPGPPQDPPVSPRRLRDRAQRDPPGTRRRGRLGVK